MRILVRTALIVMPLRMSVLFSYFATPREESQETRELGYVISVLFLFFGLLSYNYLVFHDRVSA